MVCEFAMDHIVLTIAFRIAMKSSDRSISDAQPPSKKLRVATSTKISLEQDALTVEMNLREVPKFLRCGEYYLNFLDDAIEEPCAEDCKAPINHNWDGDTIDVVGKNATINVPSNCYKTSTTIINSADLHHLLSTLRFWVVDALPDSVIAYALDGNTGHSFSAVAEPFMKDLPKLEGLQTLGHPIGRVKRLIVAMKMNACEEIVEYLFEHKDDESPLDAEVASTAAEEGSLKYLKHAHEQGCLWDASTSIKAAEGGHLDCMKYAHEHGCPFDAPEYEGCTFTAARHGHLNCLQYAHQHGASLFPERCLNTAAAAAVGGHFDCMQYALDNGCSYDIHTMQFAAESKSLDCVKCLHERGCPLDNYIFKIVVRGGELDAVLYLHREGCPWNEEVCTAAAEAGHLDCLKYLHEQGCPWNEEVCTAAAEAGQLDCLQYLHEQGCPWDEETTLAAAANGCVSCLEYAITNGCPVMHNICYKMFVTNLRYCPSCQRADCLKYLHSLGYKISGAATTAAKNAGDTPCLEYIASIRTRARSSIIEQYMDETTLQLRYDMDMAGVSVQTRSWPNGKIMVVIVKGESVEFLELPH